MFKELHMGAKVTRDRLVIVNFISLFDWAMECPNVWLNIILGVTERVLLCEINI